MPKYFVVADDYQDAGIHTTSGNEMDSISLGIAGSQMDSDIRRMRQVIYAFELQKYLKSVQREFRFNLKTINAKTEYESQFLRHTYFCESDYDPIGLQLLGLKKAAPATTNEEKARSTGNKPQHPKTNPRSNQRHFKSSSTDRNQTAVRNAKTPIHVRVERFYEAVKPLRNNITVDENSLNHANHTIKQVASKLKPRSSVNQSKMSRSISREPSRTKRFE